MCENVGRILVGAKEELGVKASPCVSLVSAGKEQTSLLTLIHTTAKHALPSQSGL